jgi:prolyl oligopeptidase
LPELSGVDSDMKKRVQIQCVALGLFAVALAGCGGRGPAASEPVDTHADDRHRWLEDWSNPAVRRWVEEEWEIGRVHLEKRGHAAASADSGSTLVDVQWRRGRLLGLKRPGAMVELSPEGERMVMNWNDRVSGFVASLSGEQVALILEDEVRFFDVESGSEIGEPLRTGGSPTSLAWDAHGVYFVRDDGEGPRVLWRAVEGGGDRLEAGPFRAGIAVRLEAHPEGEYVLAEVREAQGISHWLRMGGGQEGAGEEGGERGDGTEAGEGALGEWKQVTTPDRQARRARFGGHEFLYLLWHGRSSNGWIITVPLWDPDLRNVEPLIMDRDPGSRPVIADWIRTQNHLFVVDQTGGIPDMRLFEFRGIEMGFVPLGGLMPRQLEFVGGERVVFAGESWTRPRQWYEVDAQEVTPRRAWFDRGVGEEGEWVDVEVVREGATSKDGTRVPLTILRKKGLELDGERPSILAGYGGFGVSVLPWYEPWRREWVERGGVFAIAHVRGGSELGAAWREAGEGVKKQNAVDDFAAAAERLKELGYTRAEKLGLMGARGPGMDQGAGDVLVGAMIAQRPEAFRAAVVGDGPVGASQEMRDGSAYPAVLFVAGEGEEGKDGRKMLARLREVGARVWMAREGSIEFLAGELGLE